MTSQRPVEPSTPSGGPSRGARGSGARNAADMRAQAMDRLIESRLTPNKISMTGLVLNLAAAALITQEEWVLAGVAFIVGSIMDTLDGRFARSSGKGTPFGAFLDSTLDRVEEGIVLAAIAAYFATQNDEVAVAATVGVVLFSLMVSYTRARAEALGVENKGGIATRPVRVVILSIGIVFAEGAGVGIPDLLEPAIYVMVALTLFTTLQRVLHVRKELNASAA